MDANASLWAGDLRWTFSQLRSGDALLAAYSTKRWGRTTEVAHADGTLKLELLQRTLVVRDELNDIVASMPGVNLEQGTLTLANGRAYLWSSSPLERPPWRDRIFGAKRWQFARPEGVAPVVEFVPHFGFFTLASADVTVSSSATDNPDLLLLSACGWHLILRRLNDE